MKKLLGLAVVLPLLVFASCGSAQERPVLLATAPAAGEVVAGEVPQIRLEYDTDVFVLNPAQLAVSENGLAVTMSVWIDAAEPNVVLCAPTEAGPLGPGVIRVAVAQGLVVNADEHYSLEQYEFGFESTSAQATLRLPAPSPAVVAVAPPLGDPAPLHFLQLVDGAGTGAALAALDPEAREIKAIELSFVPGGDLVAEFPALAVSPDGRTVFAAFRDVAAERARLCRVDALALVETGTCLLSTEPSPGTCPFSLTLIEDGRRVRIRCRTRGGTQVIEVDAATLEELPPSGG